jgi:phytanoyl-CoA hydroxylase
VLEDFVEPGACARLRGHALRLAERLAAECPRPVVFTADGAPRHADERWFLDSGSALRAFHEKDAFRADGTLRAEPHLCLNKLGHALHDLDPAFASFSRTEDLALAADAIGMRDPRLLQSMYIFKQARIGGEVQCHVDHTYLWTEPRSVVGFWFAIDDATVENGCMWALPGGHRIPVKERWRLAQDGSGAVMDRLDPSPYPSEGFVPLEAPRGALVLLDGAVPHRSGANDSDAPRHAYALHAIEGWTEYPADNWLRRPMHELRGFRG